MDSIWKTSTLISKFLGYLRRVSNLIRSVSNLIWKCQIQRENTTCKYKNLESPRLPATLLKSGV